MTDRVDRLSWFFGLWPARGPSVASGERELSWDWYFRSAVCGQGAEAGEDLFE